MLSGDVIFTPDASNPNSPGFTLSAVFSLTGGSTLVLSTDELDYGVAITNPASGAVIIGTPGTETGASVSWDTTPTTTLDALAYSNITNGSSCSDSTQVGIFAPSGSVAFNWLVPAFFTSGESPMHALIRTEKRMSQNVVPYP
jgi:hypothetical protein